MGRDQRCVMNNFLFENGTKFLFGGGCVKEYLSSFLTGYGPSVLLVTDGGDGPSGAADEALAERIRALNARTGRLLRPEKEE